MNAHIFDIGRSMTRPDLNRDEFATLKFTASSNIISSTPLVVDVPKNVC